MNTIEKEIIDEQIISKSTFITYLCPVTNTVDAKNYILNIKKMHPTATHHVSAYTVGDTGEFGHCSDDGEPSGTAGLPLLEVFRKNEISNFVCVVVRYFGGIKLGAGGLIRAYSSSGVKALGKTTIIPIVHYTTFNISFNYNLINLVEKIVDKYEITEKNFSMTADYTIKVPVDDLELVKTRLTEASNNQIIFK